MQTVSIDTLAWSIVAALFAGALVGAAVATWMNWPIDFGGKREGGEA